MRHALLLVCFCGPAIFAQMATQPIACVETIGPVSFPPYAWGYAQEDRAEAIVTVQANGTAEILSLDGKPAGGGTSLEAEVQKSIGASGFDRQCAGQTLTFEYFFELDGEAGQSRDATAAKAPPNRIIITGRPPVPLCASAATSDDQAEARRGQADRLIDDWKFQEALECVDALIAWKPLAEAYVTKGVALRKLQRLEDAIAAYNEAEKLDPANRHVYFDRANSYRDLGQLELAIRDYTAAISNNSRLSPAYTNRGAVYLRLHRFDLALLDFSAAVDIDPNDFNAHNNRGLVLSHLGDHQQALEEYRQVIQLRPQGAIGYANRAGCWLSLQKYDEAIQDATTAVRLDPRYFEARFNRGVALALSGQYQAAADEFTVAIRLQPGSAESYALRALTRKELGDAEGSKADQEQVARLGRTCPTKWFTRDPVTGASIPVDRPARSKN